MADAEARQYLFETSIVSTDHQMENAVVTTLVHDTAIPSTAVTQHLYDNNVLSSVSLRQTEWRTNYPILSAWHPNMGPILPCHV